MPWGIISFHGISGGADPSSAHSPLRSGAFRGIARHRQAFPCLSSAFPMHSERITVHFEALEVVPCEGFKEAGQCAVALIPPPYIRPCVPGHSEAFQGITRHSHAFSARPSNALGMHCDSRGIPSPF